MEQKKDLKSIQHIEVNSTIQELESEINSLEKELASIEALVDEMERKVFTRFHAEIEEVKILSNLFKKLKREKKQKRLEQKKKGKNYKAPIHPEPTLQQDEETEVRDWIDEEELRRLYKEGIRKVHPDKYSMATQQEISKAHDLTIKLIDLYKCRDLERLRKLHALIISGDAWNSASFKDNVQDAISVHMYLLQKRDDLIIQMNELKSSYFYKILLEYSDPSLYMKELEQYLQNRILQLKKRTRKAKEL